MITFKYVVDNEIDIGEGTRHRLVRETSAAGEKCREILMEFYGSDGHTAVQAITHLLNRRRIKPRLTADESYFIRGKGGWASDVAL